MAPTRRRGLPHDTIPFSVIREQWMKKPGFKEAYDALEEEFNLVDALYQAQVQSGLTETELAEKMGIPLSAFRRLMGGRGNPSFKTLCRLAAATGLAWSGRDQRQKALRAGGSALLGVGDTRRRRRCA